MKNFKRISSLVVALIMIVATMSAMFVTASAADVAAGDKIVFDLALAAPGAEGTVLTTDCWKTAAIEKSTGKILPTTQASEQTWAPEWWGLWAADENGGHLNTDYLFSKTEFNNCYMDLRERNGYCGAVIFTAPVNGVYSIDAQFRVNASSVCRAYVNGQSTDLAKGNANNKNDVITLAATDIELNAGDMIVFLVEDGTAASRVGIINDTTFVTVTEVKAATGGNEGTTGGNTNPDTSDALVASLVVAVVAGVALVASKKRR